MLRYATTLTVIGFICLFVGIVSLFLNLVGVDLFFLTWLYELGGLISFGVRLSLVVIGLTLIYVGQTDWEREDI